MNNLRRISYLFGSRKARNIHLQFAAIICLLASRPRLFEGRMTLPYDKISTQWFVNTYLLNSD